jgi:hypothetical protein
MHLFDFQPGDGTCYTFQVPDTLGQQLQLFVEGDTMFGNRVRASTPRDLAA